jgi:hypothetical protein
MDKVGGTLAPNLYFHRAIKREHLFNHKTLKEGKFNKVEYICIIQIKCNHCIKYSTNIVQNEKIMDSLDK